MASIRSAAVVGTLLLGSWNLVACSDNNSASDDNTRSTMGQSTGNDTDSGDSDGSGGGSDNDQAGSGAVRAPEFLLTGAVDAPAGWVLDPANCVSTEESGPPFFDYYISGDWVRRGSGYGGSGGVTGSGDHSYELPEGSRIKVTIETDSYSGTEPMSPEGKPWTTWDRDHVEFTDSGERTTRITYTKLDPIEIDGESFDLHFLDQAQSDVVSTSEYKLRIVFGEVPTGGAAGKDRRPESATVTFSWDSDDADLPEGTVREVLSTFRLATCSQEGLVNLYETLTGTKF